MKRMGLAVVCLLLFVSTMSFAQSVAVKVNVPFAFVIGNTVVPAGEYKIMQANTYSNALAIQGEGFGMLVLPVPTNQDLNQTSQSKLLFNQYGNRYFLSEILSTATGRVYRLYPSTLEVKLASLPRSSSHVAAIKARQ